MASQNHLTKTITRPFRLKHLIAVAKMWLANKIPKEHQTDVEGNIWVEMSLPAINEPHVP